MKTALMTLLVLASLVLSPTAKADTVPSFPLIARGWISPPLVQDMTPFWHVDFGQQETGTNYYSTGAPKDGSTTWERFDPNSPMYEAWFGAYVVNNFEYASEWATPPTSPNQVQGTVAKILTLGTIDQFVWLYAYGDPAPVATLDTPSTTYLGNGQFLLRVNMQTHSDFGASSPPFPWVPDFAPYASQVAPFAPVTLPITFVFTYDTTAQELYVRYASGTEWTTLDGCHHETPQRIYTEQALMMAATRF
jgi:hypothetical protein